MTNTQFQTRKIKKGRKKKEEMEKQKTKSKTIDLNPVLLLINGIDIWLKERFFRWIDTDIQLFAAIRNLFLL